jgi:hypothetical protein
MRLVKLGPRVFKNTDEMEKFFEIDLPERNPPGPPSHRPPAGNESFHEQIMQIPAEFQAGVFDFFAVPGHREETEDAAENEPSDDAHRNLPPEGNGESPHAPGR